MQRDNIKILDIEECIKRIELFTQGFEYNEFINDIKTQDAVIRNLEIIGEAAKNLSENFKNNHPNIAWNEIGRLRDKLIHHYSGINFDIIWQIIQKDIPNLKYELSKI